MIIKLKKKYLVGGKSRYKGGPNAAPLKHRRKMSDVQKRSLPEQPRMARYVNGSGNGVMGRVK